MKKHFFIFTCEHASNAIPLPLKPLFKNHAKLLATHRGWDIGVLTIAQDLAKTAKSPLILGKYSRLVVDLNRSVKNETLFSPMTWALSLEKREKLIQKYHKPHWHKIHQLIQQKIKEGFCVIHIGVHSFTPILHGKIRNCEIGLLFDPKHPSESQLCQKWQKTLQKQSPYRIRRNYPYRGTGDGMTTHLRTSFGSRNYLGIEIEINQACLLDQKIKAEISKLLCKLVTPT